MKILNKKILILGAGKTGLSTATFCKERGANVFLYDEKNNIFMPEMQKMGINFNKKNFNTLTPSNYDYIIQSPGIPRNHIFLKKADKLNIPVLGEIEFIYNFCKIPIIAVSGTNGKTTVVYFLKHLFKNCKKKVNIAGNVGFPFSSVLNNSLDRIILEVSSYQLESVYRFKPNIAILTNLTQDHLERHSSMSKYLKIKEKIFSKMDKNDFLIINADDKYFEKIIRNKNKFKTYCFSLKKVVNGIYLKDKYIYLNVDKYKNIKLFNISIIKVIGMHNIENAMSAFLAAYLSGCSLKCLKKGISSFTGVEHRLEFVKIINGVMYYNDSKSTNPEATVTALKVFSKNKVYLIMGGSFKKANYENLIKKIKLLNVIPIIQGETKKEIKSIFRRMNLLSFLEAKNMKEALYLAKKNARKKDIVLLSPSCPSFDQFENFEKRGEKFKEYLNEF